MKEIIDIALRHPYQCSHELVGSQSIPFEYKGEIYYTKKMDTRVYHLYKQVVSKQKIETGRGKSKTTTITEIVSWKFNKEIVY